MPGPVTYACNGTISRIVMDDGKANVMSLSMLNALHSAFDECERDKAIAVLSACGRHFSGGFDLNVFAKGSADDQYQMVKAGAELALRILSFPRPVVTACHGNAYPMGAFLIMASDYRLAAQGDYRIGMNEVAIGITPPRFAIEVARQRLAPAYLSRTVVTGEMFGPEEALTAGFFDRLVPAADLARATDEAATAISKISLANHALAKQHLRGEVIARIRRVIDEDITPRYGEERVARRTAAG